MDNFFFEDEWQVHTLARYPHLPSSLAGAIPRAPSCGCGVLLFTGVLSERKDLKSGRPALDLEVPPQTTTLPPAYEFVASSLVPQGFS